MKTSKRRRSTYPGLEKSLNLKIRSELIDYDYIDKLSHEEKQWLSNFTEEYVSANFNHKGKRIHPKKIRTRKAKTTGKKKKVDLLKQDCEKQNNLRNNDVFSVTKSNGMLKEESSIGRFEKENRNINVNETEDVLIALLDVKPSDIIE